MGVPQGRLMSDEGEFSDDVVVLTGGTKGIGREIALGFAERDATLIATYYSDDDAARTLADNLAEYDIEYRVECCDVRDYEAVGELFEMVEDEFGQITVLVNNAGIVDNQLLMRMSPEQWQDVIDVNLTGTFNCTQQVSKSMMFGSGGRIVNVSSSAGIHGEPGQANYAASKAGIIGFTSTVANELGSRGIRVNAVAPSLVDTKMSDEMIDQEAWLEEKDLPIERMGTPDEVAECIYFLASERASYLNGVVLPIDGGLHA